MQENPKTIPESAEGMEYLVNLGRERTKIRTAVIDGHTYTMDTLRRVEPVYPSRPACFSASTLSGFASRAPGSEIVRLQIALMRLIGRRYSAHQAWLQLEGRSGDLLGTRAVVTCHELFLAIGGAGGCVGFVVVAAGHGRGGAGDVGLTPHLVCRLVELLAGGLQFHLTLEV